jgi:hypothetical protein
MYKIFIDMKKKLIITESQFNRIIAESNQHSSMVKIMKEFLDKSYEPNESIMREGGEYFKKHMVKVKADEEIISVENLYEYMKYKFEAGDEFTKQVIRDWMFNKITDDYQLSKNVAVN